MKMKTNMLICKKDAMDLLHGHYIVSVNRDMSHPFQKRGLESLAVSLSLMYPEFIHYIYIYIIFNVKGT